MHGKPLFRPAAAALLFSLLAACAASPAAQNAAGPAGAAKPRGRLVRTEPAEAPAWKNSVPQSPAEIFFVGVSDLSASAAEARDGARRNAASQIARFYGQFLQESMNVRSRYAENAGTVLEDLAELDSDITAFAQTVVTQINADQYFTEVYQAGKGGEGYVVYALCAIPRQKAEEDIRNFAGDISKRYGNLITRQDSFITALNSYNHVLGALEQNPLHRAAAVYNGKNGPVNLYDFLVTEMNNLAAGVTFSPLASTVQQNDEALNMTLRLASSYANMGPLECTASINGAGGIRVSALAAPDNTVKISLPTGPLNRGRYTVVFELPLKERYPVIRTNPQGSWMFAVSSVNAAVVFEGAAPTARERASITEGIQQGIQRYNAPLRLVPGNTEYVIAVDLRTGSQPVPGAKFSMYSCTMALALLRNGTIVYQSPVIKGDNGLSAGEAFGNTLAALRNSGSFFQGIGPSLDK
jgi:hypothetical protein